jgi:hypothetical protein
VSGVKALVTGSGGDWSITYDLEKIFAEMIECRQRQRKGGSG